MTFDSGNTIKAFCNDCEGETNHYVCHQEDRKNNETFDAQIMTCYETFEMIACCGCEAIKFRRIQELTGEDKKSIEYFPPISFRRMPIWIQKVNPAIRALLEEVYLALNHDSRRLAMMGARAIIDTVIQDTIGDYDTFGEKLTKLKKTGHISPKKFEVLFAALNVGTAASHRGYEASEAVTTYVMDIVENLLESVYVFPSIVDAIRVETPQRQRR